PLARPREKLPALFVGLGSGKLVERLGKFTAALRKQNSGGIELVSRLRGTLDGLLEVIFFGELRAAFGASGEVGDDPFALFGGKLVARVKHKKRSDIFAAGKFRFAVHRSPANSVRSFRVARNREFFTVSSVVPSASPMARSFSP